MHIQLNKLTIKGFKSIKALENFELRNLNVLIGANGSGKSNFIEIFHLLKTMTFKGLSDYVAKRGSADSFFFNGPKETSAINMSFWFGDYEYQLKLEPTADEKLLITNETQKKQNFTWGETAMNGKFESHLDKVNDVFDTPDSHIQTIINTELFDAISNWVVYHFHDTSSLSPMRRSEIIEDNKYLRPNADNIAPFLLKLKNETPSSYQEIISTIRLAAPFFDYFILEPSDKETVNLSWRQKGSDFPMRPHQFSDGTLRFICLVTALLQPHPPAIIVIDEPELGLHPYAIELLAELIQAVSQKTQVIISTQSPTLLDYFTPEDIIITNRKDGASIFQRLTSAELSTWLDDYTVGELWRKNIIVAETVNE